MRQNMRPYELTASFTSGKPVFRIRVTSKFHHVATFEIPIEDVGRFLKGEIYIPGEGMIGESPNE